MRFLLRFVLSLQKSTAMQATMQASLRVRCRDMVNFRRQDFIHHHRWREKIATDTFTPSPAPVVYKISGPMGGGFLCTSGAEAENSAVKFSKESVPSLYKKIGLC